MNTDPVEKGETSSQQAHSSLPVRRSARLLIIDDANRLLLFRYKDEHSPQFWATPGGELVGDESYIDAAKREVKEEIGCDLPIGPLVAERSAVYAVARSTTALWLERYYIVHCPSGQAVRKDGWSDEEQSTIQNWKWWSLDDVLLTAAHADNSLDRACNQSNDGDDDDDDVQLFKPTWIHEIFQYIVTEYNENSSLKVFNYTE